MSTQCSLSDPVSGELTVEASAIPISSIDLHLLRVESILLGEKIVTEKSVVQTTQVYALSHLVDIYNSTYLSLTNPWGLLFIYQIADGDVCHHMTLPIHVILPRLLTCPTVLAG